MPWNVGDHRRKYLRGPGRYVDADDHVSHSDLVFWGEWEPPSGIERRWPAHGRLPRALHRPYWIRPAAGGSRQNTDPWVFGERMRYSNCKQIVGPRRRGTSMQKLPTGSVICFGSTMDHEFCVDTVFVVASAEPWTPADVADIEVDTAFAVCTAGSIKAGGTDAHAHLTLYRGATVEDPVHGMHSFVPALPVGDETPRFARPVVRLAGLINPASKQSTWGSKRPLPMSAVRHAWEAIRHQIHATGLVLAVKLDTPPEEAVNTVMPASRRTRC
jgi:hypothetical protein